MKIPFAIKKDTAKYISINNVKSGLKCNCICPSCKMDLVARKGKIKEHHFAHHKEAESICSYSFWVAVRDMAEQLLKENFKQIKLPVESLDEKKMDNNIVFSNLKNKRQAKTSKEKRSWDYYVFKKGRIFSLSPNNKLVIKSIKKCEGKNHDYLLDTTIGNIHLLLLTSEPKRSQIYIEKSTFVENIKIVINLKFLEEIKTEKVPKALEEVLFSLSKRKTIFSPTKKTIKHNSVSGKCKTSTKTIIDFDWERHATEKRESWKERQKRKERIKERRREVKRDGPDEKMMKGFAEYMMESYLFEDKRSENLSIVHKGRDLWFISINKEFYFVAFSGLYILYTIEKEDIKILGDAQTLEEISNMNFFNS